MVNRSSPSIGLPRLVGVYNADGGLLGEIVYVVGHLLGRVECALCDITHSPIRQKTAWKDMVTRLAIDLGYDMVTRHRNEVSEAEHLASTGQEPCVLVERADGTWEILLNTEELAVLAGRVDDYERAVRAKLRAR